MYTQPTLIIPPEIERGLLDGSLKLFGSIVRDSDNGQIVKHLKNAVPSQEQVEQAVRRLNPRIAVPVVAATVVVGGVATYVMRKRRTRAERFAQSETRPEAVFDFESSLREYVDAGRTGTLTPETVERLITDLDSLKAISESGDDIWFPLDELVPLFDLVIAHTPRLADAYGVDLDDLDNEVDEPQDGVVLSLRRHLEAQKAILTEAA